MLFRPDLIGEECEGLHEVLNYSIQKSDLDLRKVLFQNIVLSGGSTLHRVRINFKLLFLMIILKQFFLYKNRVSVTSGKRDISGKLKIPWKTWKYQGNQKLKTNKNFIINYKML